MDLEGDALLLPIRARQVAAQPQMPGVENLSAKHRYVFDNHVVKRLVLVETQFHSSVRLHERTLAREHRSCR